jgi:hypothetical protein
MPGALAQFFGLLIVSCSFGGFAWFNALRLEPEKEGSRFPSWLISWATKGILVPLFIWGIMNLGISWQLQPFMPQIQASRNGGGPWGPIFVHFLGSGLFIISSYWAAATLGWALLRADGAEPVGRRADFRRWCRVFAFALVVPAGLVVWLGGLPWLGVALALVFGPTAFYLPELMHPKKLPPVYAKAVARMKFGKYAEAEWEIIRELEKYEDDFEGWIMLAELYATKFRDLKEAERTVLDLCDHPQTTPSQLSVALHRLADWHLKVGQNPEGARRALQRVCDRLPGTHLAHMARLRLNQVPMNSEEFKETQASTTIPLPALGDAFDDEPVVVQSPVARKEAARLANSLADRLRQDPNNTEAREKFARILAERMNKPGLGIEQIDLLLAMPEQPERKRAEWLSLSAAWYFKYRQDPTNGRKVLERLVREFPQTPQALAARRRLELAERESRRQQAMQSNPIRVSPPRLSS